MNKISNNESQDTEVSEAQGFMQKHHPLHSLCQQRFSQPKWAANDRQFTQHQHMTHPGGTLSSQHPSGAEQHIQTRQGWRGKEQSLGAAALSKLVHFGMLFQLKVMSNSDGIYFALSRRTGHYLDQTTVF